MRSRLLLPLLLPALLLAACEADSPERGEVVSAGVAHATFGARSGGFEPFDVVVAFPAEADGTPLRADAARPGVVLVPGGLVDRDRYLWLADALALRGYVVAVPEASYELALLDEGRIDDTRALLRSGRGLLRKLVGEKVAVMGHSLGAVVAADQALEGQWSALVLLAGYAQEGTKWVGARSIPSLTLAGKKDCSAALATVEAGWARLPSPAFFTTLEGVTHYQFTDSQAEDEPDCAPAIPIETAHSRIAVQVGDFLDGALRSDARAWDRLTQPSEGVVGVRR